MGDASVRQRSPLSVGSGARLRFALRCIRCVSTLPSAFTWKAGPCCRLRYSSSSDLSCHESCASRNWNEGAPPCWKCRQPGKMVSSEHWQYLCVPVERPVESVEEAEEEGWDAAWKHFHQKTMSRYARYSSKLCTMNWSSPEIWWAWSRLEACL